jgi:hypothetical protein
VTVCTDTVSRDALRSRPGRTVIGRALAALPRLFGARPSGRIPFDRMDDHMLRDIGLSRPVDTFDGRPSPLGRGNVGWGR